MLWYDLTQLTRYSNGVHVLSQFDPVVWKVPIAWAALVGCFGTVWTSRLIFNRVDQEFRLHFPISAIVGPT